MSNSIYTDEQKMILIKSLQATIDEHKKAIITAQELIRQISGIQAPVVNTSERKVRDGGIDWFGKIKNVLDGSLKPMTSREILDRIYEENPDFEKDVAHMGSLSSVIRGKVALGELTKHKSEGEFARFDLGNSNIIGLTAVNQ